MVKVISLSDAAYEALQRLKGGDQSFSDVVLALAEKERVRRLDSYFGAWKMTDKEYDEFMEDVHERRRRAQPRRRVEL